MAVIRRVVLIGFRAAGKSTVARELSALLQWNCVSTDALVEAELGEKISVHVARTGWASFRRAESRVVKALAVADGEMIIDCGGGVVEDAGLMQVLLRDALCVWVDASPRELHRRLSQAGDRPLLSEKDLRSDVLRHYQRRRPLYRRYSQLHIDTRKFSAAEAGRRIAAHLGRIPSGE